MSTFRLANPTIILLSAAMALIAAFAPGPFSLGGTALAQELPTDNPPVNLRVTSYGHDWVSVAWEVPRDRGITYFILRLSNGWSVEDQTGGGYGHGWTQITVEPDTQYSFVLTLQDDSKTTIIETSVSFRTLPAPDPDPQDPQTPDPDPQDPQTPDPDPQDPQTPDPDPQDPQTPDPDPQDPQTPDPDPQDPQTPDPDPQDPPTPDPDPQDPPTPDPDPQDPPTPDPDPQDPPTPDPDPQTPTEVTGALPTDNPPVNFRVTSYGHDWVSVAWEIPHDRGITYFILRSSSGWSVEDSTGGGYGHGWTQITVEPDTQYSFVLTLQDDSKTTIIEASVSGRTPPAPDPPTPDPDPQDPPTPAPDPHSLTKVSGDNQEGTASVQLAEPFVVSVLDLAGAPLAGVIVSFSVTAGGGLLSSTTDATDANGRATTRLTLGSDAGTNTVAATVEGLEPVTFTATAIKQMPHSLTKVSGDGQQGQAGQQLAKPFVVSVLDQNGAAFAGASVTFSVTAGGGTLSAATTTDANGRAATRLTLGSDAGTNTVAATVEGLDPVTFTATAIMPHSLTKVSGDGQQGQAGEQLAKPFLVLVLDEDDAAIAGAVITFTVTGGGGTMSSTTAMTNSSGRAARTLTLGDEPGTNTVDVSVAGLDPVTFTATAVGEEPAFDLSDLFNQSGKRVALPDNTQLLQNAPNPFNSQTIVSYFLLEPGPVRLEVFALSGQRIAVLDHGLQQAGYHRLHWDGRDAAGHSVASGTYLYRLVTDEVVLTRKLVLLR